MNPHYPYLIASFGIFILSLILLGYKSWYEFKKTKQILLNRIKNVS